MIDSLLDNDFYAFTMANAIHEAAVDSVLVRYEFRNRTFAVPLAKRVDLDLLKNHIAEIQSLRFSEDEIQFLHLQGLFSPGWLKSLETVRLPDVEVWQENGHLCMRYEGRWTDAIYWESMLLALVNELYYDRFGAYYAEGEHRLFEKIDYLKERGTLKFVEFGTRRRFSKSWQHFVVHTLKDECPDLMLGTSNVALAKELDLTPKGTMAHQLFMVYTAEAVAAGRMTTDGVNPIVSGANEVMKMWLDAYDSPSMLTVLPDTYTTDTFLDGVSLALLGEFKAFRQDSGDPIAIGEKIETLARRLTIGPPTIMFSDSLDVRKMSVIEDHFAGRINMVSGWGTNLTNDLGYEPLSIVIKPSWAKWRGQDWEPCVKLSDDPQKVTGQSARYYQVAADLGFFDRGGAQD